MAGKIPDIKPITAANPVPRSTFPIPKTKSKSNALVRIIEIIQTKTSPIKPPITDRITASNRNWNKIKRFFAPNDFWIPIKLVRSLTETNMILAIPKPPTKKIFDKKPSKIIIKFIFIGYVCPI